VTTASRRIAITSAALLAVPAVALAASPKKGATYVGEKGGGSTSLEKKVSVRVSSSGKTGQAFLYCGSGRAPSGSPKFKIKKGRFTVRKRTGSLTIWSLTRGKFTSANKATAYLNVNAICDGKSDGNITLKLKTPTPPPAPSSGY
jgi:hypothetical protein